jgi:MerR, DNA binding
MAKPDRLEAGRGSRTDARHDPLLRAGGAPACARTLTGRVSTLRRGGRRPAPFIKGGQRLGLRLREIRELLEVLDRGLCPCGHTEALLRRRIGEIEAEMEQLRDLKRQLARVLERFPAEQCDDGGWPCGAEIIRTGNEGEDDDS